MKKPVAAALLALLAACATPPPKPPPADPLAQFRVRQLQLGQIDSWALEARAAVRQGDEGGSVSLAWQQTPTDYHLELSGPFGASRVLIDGNAEGARLQRDGETLLADSAEVLLLQTLGWSVPVADLRLWILGRPGSSGDYEIDEWGRLKRLQSDGWQIDYQRYSEVGELELPDRLTLQADDLRVRLLVGDWRLNAMPDEPAAMPVSTPGARPFSSGFGE